MSGLGWTISPVQSSPMTSVWFRIMSQIYMVSLFIDRVMATDSLGWFYSIPHEHGPFCF